MDYCYYDKENEVVRDHEEAARWFRFAQAHCGLGWYYFKKDNYTESFVLSIDRGNTLAMSNIGTCYERCYGVNRNLKEADISSRQKVASCTEEP